MTVCSVCGWYKETRHRGIVTLLRRMRTRDRARERGLTPGMHVHAYRPTTVGDSNVCMFMHMPRVKGGEGIRANLGDAQSISISISKNGRSGRFCLQLYAYAYARRGTPGPPHHRLLEVGRLRV